MASVSELSINSEKILKTTTFASNEPKRLKIPRVDPARTLEPARKKVSTIEGQRVLHTMLESFKCLEIAINIEYIIDNRDRFSVAFGKRLMKSFERHEQLMETFENYMMECEQFFNEKQDKRKRELFRRIRRGSDIFSEKDAYLVEEMKIKDENGEMKFSPEPPKSPSPRNDDSKPSSPRPKSVDSLKSQTTNGSRIANSLAELEQKLVELNKVIHASIRNIMRQFTVDHSAYDAFHKDVENDEIEYEEEIEEFIKIIYQLRELITHKLLTTPTEEFEKNKYIREIEVRGLSQVNIITKLEAELNELMKIKEKDISSKNDISRSLQIELHTIERVSEENIKQVKNDADKQELSDMKNSEQKRSKLWQEVTALKQQYQNELNEHRTIETDLRNKKFKNETEVDNWISRYDENMSSRQEKYEEIDKQYTKEKAQLNELEIRFKTLKTEYDFIMAERQAEKEKKESEIRKMQDSMHAATTIQAFWRSFKVRKAIKSKKKGKKGKGKKK